MQWVELITLLSGLQLIAFGMMVGRARKRYGLALPAMAGNQNAERYIRGHLNSVEWIVIFLPALWIASRYWSPYVTAGIGAIYLIGRTLYFAGYIQAVAKRNLGFIISSLATLALILLGVVGLIRALMAV